jgi:hypothetical protein
VLLRVLCALVVPVVSNHCLLYISARAEGFEPPSPGLEAGMFPVTCKPAFVDETGFEPVLSVLQTAALPLELFVLEDEERFELSTICLTSNRSAIELFIQINRVMIRQENIVL